MTELEKVLWIVGIIWLAHIPFVVPFFVEAKKADKKRSEEQ